jgi:hypothetical protein
MRTVCTVTVIVCGASTAPGAETVMMPVYPAGDAASDAVFSANVSGMQLAAAEVDAHARAAPTVGVIHAADELSESDSVPSPALYASTTCVTPFVPGVIEMGPKAAVTTRKTGVASSDPSHPDAKTQKNNQRTAERAMAPPMLRPENRRFHYSTGKKTCKSRERLGKRAGKRALAGQNLPHPTSCRTN